MAAGFAHLQGNLGFEEVTKRGQTAKPTKQRKDSLDDYDEESSDEDLAYRAATARTAAERKLVKEKKDALLAKIQAQAEA